MAVQGRVGAPNIVYLFCRGRFVPVVNGVCSSCGKTVRWVS